MKATIFDIQHSAAHDNNCFRSTVFFKGCPLRCLWCHTPEGLVQKPQLAYYAHKCVGCGECIFVCPTDAHSIDGVVHVLDTEKCISCGECEDACYGDALKLYGKEVTVEEVLSQLLNNRESYKNSGGGVTLSGGECLMQADFCAELLKRLKHEGIHTTVDTCGFCSKEALDKVIPYTDTFLYDLKAFDEDIHIRCTGQTNVTILENLRYLDSCGKKIEICYPFVPGWNDNQAEKLAAFVNTLTNITSVRVLPYQGLDDAKYKALGVPCVMPEELPKDDALAQADKIFQKVRK